MFKNNVFNVSVDTKKWIKAAAVRAVKTMAQPPESGDILSGEFEKRR